MKAPANGATATITAATAHPGRWHWRVDYLGILGTVDANLTTPALLDEVAGFPEDWPIRLAVEDVTRPIGPLPTDGMLYATMSPQDREQQRFDDHADRIAAVRNQLNCAISFHEDPDAAYQCTRLLCRLTGGSAQLQYWQDKDLRAAQSAQLANWGVTDPKRVTR